MEISIQAEINRYHLLYPLSNQSQILKQMVADGVITQDIAKKIEGGISLFVSDQTMQKSDEVKPYDISSVMGASFSKKDAPKPQFNRHIEPTQQSPIQVDCWLLSDINALSQTEWGRDLIQKSLVPDEDGRGVTVRFEGSPLSQKNFHITAEDIQAAKEIGRYSTGDDDMIAFELATERVHIKLEEEGLGTLLEHPDIGYKSPLTNARIDEELNKYSSISELLGSKRSDINFFVEGADKSKLPILRQLSQNIGNYAAVCTFDHYADLFDQRDKNDSVHGGHAYAIKNIDFGKEVVVVDPYHADQEIRIKWNKFVGDVESLFVTSKNEDYKKTLESKLPKNYEEIIRKDSKDRKEDIAQIKEEARQRKEEYEQLKQQQEYERDMEDINYNLRYLTESALRNVDEEYWFVPGVRLEIPNLKKAADKFNKDNIMEILDSRPDLVKGFIKISSGLRHRDQQRNLVMPIINSLADLAKNKGIPQDNIDSFVSKCTDELNSTFSSDADLIDNEVKNFCKLLTE